MKSGKRSLSGAAARTGKAIKKGKENYYKKYGRCTLKMENHQPNRENMEIRNTRYYR